MKKERVSLWFSRRPDEVLKVNVNDVVAWLQEHNQKKLAKEFIVRSNGAGRSLSNMIARELKKVEPKGAIGAMEWDYGRDGKKNEKTSWGKYIFSPKKPKK